MIGGKVGARVVGTLLLTAFLVGCGIGGRGAADRNQNLEGFTPEQIFERGEFELAQTRTEDAAWYFSEIERLYPYSNWAKRAPSGRRSEARSASFQSAIAD